MDRALKWLAVSPLASALKFAAGAYLAYLLQNIDSLNLSPAVSVAVAAALPVLINALNKQDTRYGVGKPTE